MVRKQHPKRRGPGRPKGTGNLGKPPTGRGAMIGIRWQKPLLEGLDRYAREQHLLDRGAALRHIVGCFLAEKGLITQEAAE